jgi:hypothetical protein
MKKPRPKMSAALAIAIERQVDDIIALAKTRCALQAHFSNNQTIAEHERADEANFIRPRAESISALARREADDRLELEAATARLAAARGLGEILGSQADRNELHAGFAGPTVAATILGPRGIWILLRLLFARRFLRP